MGIGVEETLDLIRGGNELALDLTARILEDGLEAEDVEEFLERLKQDEKFKAVLSDMFDGAKRIPAEIDDLTLVEGAQLGIVQVGYVPRWVALIREHKKRKAAERDAGPSEPSAE